MIKRNNYISINPSKPENVLYEHDKTIHPDINKCIYCFAGHNRIGIYFLVHLLYENGAYVFDQEGTRSHRVLRSRYVKNSYFSRKLFRTRSAEWFAFRTSDWFAGKPENLQNMRAGFHSLTNPRKEAFSLSDSFEYFYTSAAMNILEGTTKALGGMRLLVVAMPI
jgi:hypothetical protein